MVWFSSLNCICDLYRNKWPMNVSTFLALCSLFNSVMFVHHQPVNVDLRNCTLLGQVRLADV